MIESRDGTLSLIPFSERGSAYEQQVPDRREMRAFVCRQFKKQDVLWASEVQSVRDFGSESATQQVQTEVAYRLRKLRQDAETTFEYHLLNGIQGIVKDPKDNATVVNYFTEFGISPAAEIDFDLDNASPASGALRKRCQALIEDVEASMGGLSAGAVQVRAECGSAFFADLVAHKEVRETYLNTAAAADLRGRVADEVSFGGITFRRYRGGVGFGVPTDKAFFFPEGIEGLFEIYYAPADTFETVNTLGLPLYARTIPDRDRDEWVRLEIESNPLPICTRPQVLRSRAADLMTAFAAALDALFADAQHRPRCGLHRRGRRSGPRPRGHAPRGRDHRLRRGAALVGDHPARPARRRGSEPAPRRPDRDRRRGLPHSGRARPRPRAAGLDVGRQAGVTSSRAERRDRSGRAASGSDQVKRFIASWNDLEMLSQAA